MNVSKADLNALLASSHSMYSLDFLITKYLLSICRLDRLVFLFHVYIIENLLNIVSKTSLVHTAVCPNITTVAIFLIILVCSYVNVTVIFRRFPTALSMSGSIYELALIAWSICPNIFTLSMEFSIFILPFVSISIYKNFTSKTLLHTFKKSTIIVLLIWQF